MRKYFLIFLSMFLWSTLNGASANSLPTCAGQLDTLDTLVLNYVSAAVTNDSNAAGETFKNILAILKDKQNDSECRNALELKYLSDSLKTADQTAAIGGERPMNEVWADNFEGHRMAPSSIDYYERSFSIFRFANRVSNLILSMYKKGKIVFLSDDFRDQQRGKWLDQLDGNYLASGGYDCGSSTLMIDPYQRPLDLAIAAFHELGHLVLDKTTSPQESGFMKDGIMDWDSYSLDEEFSAMLFSASSQADLQGLHSKDTKKINFKINDDLTTFSLRGPFFDIFERVNGEDDGLKVAVNTFTANTIVSGNATITKNPKQDVQIEKDIATALEKLWQAYFPTTAISAPQSLTIRHSGKNLSDFLRDGRPLDSPPNEAQDTVNDQMILESLNAPSAVCRLYEADLLKGGIKGYLGTEFSALNHTSESSPSVVRPCLRVHGGL